MIDVIRRLQKVPSDKLRALVVAIADSMPHCAAHSALRDSIRQELAFRQGRGPEPVFELGMIPEQDLLVAATVACGVLEKCSDPLVRALLGGFVVRCAEEAEMVRRMSSSVQ